MLGKLKEKYQKRPTDDDNIVQTTTKVTEGTSNYRTMAFIGGVAMILTSVLSSIESVLHFRIVDVVISGYCTLFGILICIVEGQNFIPNYDILLPIRVSVLRFLPFLKYLWGRGALYTFSGALQLSQLRPMNIFSGLFLVGVGILFVAVGVDTHRRLSNLKNALGDEQTLIRQFKQYDVNHTGALNREQFTQLILSLTENNIEGDELEAAFSYVDMDDDGSITLDDLKIWWNTFDADTEANGGMV